MFAGGLVSGLATENTLRKNYYLFSVYTVDLSVLALFGQNVPKQVKFLGIANQFVPLEEWQVCLIAGNPPLISSPPLSNPPFC